VTLICEKPRGYKSRDTIEGMDVLRVGNRYQIHLLAPAFVNRMADEYDVVVDDIAHAVPWFSSWVSNRPVVGIVHHVHQSVLPLELRPPLSVLTMLAEKSIRFAYSSIITASYSTSRDLQEQLGVAANRIGIVHYGVDHAIYKPGDGKFYEPTVLWLGRIKKYKNLDHLVRAFGMIEAKVPDARLMIAGSGDYEPYAIGLAKSLGLRNVSFLGRVSPQEKLELLKRSWAIAYTSVMEGWGLGILEAAACGTPALGYDSGATKEAIIDNETGLLTTYGDIEGLANIMYRMLTESQLRERLTRGALSFASQFDWDRAASQTLSILEDSCKG